ncbi:MAG: sugar ABC transporter ATP-binding protein [Bifidobacteriaceae bacterium]|jgi:ribose transport system ATP-binding protein|nr:sugar ABC transporter ATP-binding protein [Bifidobacteriaceae bacterium]
MTTAVGTPLVAVEGLGKAYVRNTVLHDLDLSFHAGRVYGLMGENGAGKSTFANILSGLTHADSGRILIDGEPQSFKAPKDALDKGIAIITQEQSLALDRSCAENVFFGQLDSRLGFVNQRALRRRFDELRDEAGFAELRADAIVRGLSQAKRQQVEIMRALARDARVVIMDEPTAILSIAETRGLLDLIRRLAADGRLVLLISHFLEDVLAVADEVVVLRDGGVTFAGPAEGQTPRSLTRYMVGREVEIDHQRPAEIPADAPVRLEVSRLTRPDGVGPVSFSVRAGEIVGLAGLIGAGRSEIARAVFGLDQISGGYIAVDGVELRQPSPRRAIRHGLALVSEDRKRDGLSLVHSVRENSSLVVRRTFSKLWFRTARPEKAAVREQSEQMSVKARSIEQTVWQLSGGNQQKVMFTKWVMSKPKVLIVDEPTRGVDVGAKAQIYRIIQDLAAEGIAVLVISSEIEEVMGLSHRLLVMRRGQMVREFAWGEASRTEVIEAAFGDYREDKAEEATGGK